MRYAKLILGAFVVVFSLKFGAGYVFSLLSGEDQEAPSAAGTSLWEESLTSSANEEVEKKAEAEAEMPGNQEPKPARTPQRNALFLKRLNLPDGKNADGVPDKNYHVHALCLDATGTRAIAVSQANTWCLDTTTGKILQTFRGELPTNNTRPQFIAASPDARFVVIPSADGKEVTLRDPATARIICTYRVSDPSKLYKLQLENRLPGITPAEDFLLVGAGASGTSTIHAFSTKTGIGSILDTTRVDLKQRNYTHMLPIPQWSTILVGGGRVEFKTNPSNIAAVDLSTGKETPLTSLRHPPLFTDHRPMVLSPNGALLLVKGLDNLEVADWHANRLLFHHSEKLTHYDHACFTPDGKRFAVITRANKVVQYQTDLKTGKTTSHRIDDVVQLFDIASQEKIGSFTPHDFGLDSLVRALAMSHDGKFFVVWTGSEITMIDFQAAFAVAPLPPSPRLEGPEQLPLKQATDKAEPPRKRK